MKHVLAVLALCTGLAGCAARWLVDSDVLSFSSLGNVPAGAALERVGLRRDDANPKYTAQIGARVTAELSPWVDIEIPTAKH